MQLNTILSERVGLVGVDELLAMLKSAKSVGWNWDLKSGRDVWFGDLQTLFGMAGDTYVGRPEDFRRFVHHDDRERVWRLVAQAKRERTQYAAEFRIVRPDGSIRWVEAKGRFSYATSGEATRMAGVAADITDRRALEEQSRRARHALSNLSHKLLDAHEKERTRIARELHDDFAQRMTLVAIELDGLATALPQRTELQAKVQTLYDRVVDLARDIQNVSHHLHSSKLDYVGLAGASAGYCEEMASQHGVAIDFQHAGLPSNLPKAIALGLFRVLQEALTNAVKHSRSVKFKIRLVGDAESIRLDVIDSGIGFDVEEGLKTNGLGLLSMQERLNLLGGDIVIDSSPESGTCVHVRVPLPLSPRVVRADA